MPWMSEYCTSKPALARERARFFPSKRGRESMIDTRNFLFCLWAVRSVWLTIELLAMTWSATVIFSRIKQSMKSHSVDFEVTSGTDGSMEEMDNLRARIALP